MACFHNALSVRFVAESLPLAPTFDVLSTKNDDDDKNSTTASSLDFESIFASAKPAQSSPSRNDKKGTSFDWAPFGYAQSDLGPRLTHFLGAVELYCGREIALEAARRAFFDLDGDTGNIPYEGAQLLATLSKKYNPQNVSKALLAAQGLNTRFLSRSIVVRLKGRNAEKKSSDDTKVEEAERQDEDEEIHQQQDEKGEEAETMTGTTNSSKNVQVHNVDNNNNKSAMTMLNNSNTQKISPSSHALGPGMLNMVQKWSDKVLLSSKNKNNNSIVNLHELFGGSGFDKNDSNNHHQQWPHRTTLPVVETNADRTGIPDIISTIQYANRKIQNNEVKDSDFHDKSDNKNKDGVEFSSRELSSVIGISSETSLSTNANKDGENFSSSTLSTKSIVNTLTQPHDRLFEVTFIRDPIISSTNFRREVYSTDVPKDQGQGREIVDFTKSSFFDFDSSSSAKIGPKVLAKGVGSSFGEARKVAAMNYLQGVISDLSIL